jgi:CubicO group peptidase (beta-lactamase class C family)
LLRPPASWLSRSCSISLGLLLALPLGAQRPTGEASLRTASEGRQLAEQTARRSAQREKQRDSLRRVLVAVLQRAVADSAFPGAVATVGTSRGPLVTVSAGHLDWAPSPVPNEHSLYDIASLTKVVGTTSAVMQLVQKGAIRLDAPVQQYLPEWQGAGKERATVQQLLTHQAGLPSFKTYYKLNVSPDSTLRLFLTTDLDTVPGARMVYSDISAILLGKIVERVSGQSLDQYLRRNVFEPLGMKETQYRPAISLRSRIAPTEVDPWRGRHLVGEVHDENAYALGGVSGHAGLFSSAYDLGRLAQAYLRGGALDGARLADASTLHRFTTVLDSNFSSRALGWDTPSGNSSAGHYLTRPAFGHTGYTGTSVWIAPQHDLYVILLSNRVNPTRANQKIGAVRVAVADAVMRVLEPGVVAAVDARQAISPSTTGHP